MELFGCIGSIGKLHHLNHLPSYLNMNSELRILCVNDCYKPERFSMLKTLRGLHNGPGETKLGENALIYLIFEALMTLILHPPFNLSFSIILPVLPGDFLGGSMFAGTLCTYKSICIYKCIDLHIYLHVGTHVSMICIFFASLLQLIIMINENHNHIYVHIYSGSSRGINP